MHPIFQDEAGDVWLGGRSLSVWRDSHFSAAFGGDGVLTRAVTAITQDRTGRLWFGNWGGVYYYENGKITDFSPRLGASSSVFAIRETADGALWFATSNGLFRRRNGATTQLTVADGLAGNDVKVIYESPGGTLWFGTYGGLSKYEDGVFTSYTTADGLSSNQIRSLSLYEEAGGALWIGSYDGGLTRLKDGKFTRYTTSDGLFNNGVFQILEDAAGNFWMSSNRGIYRIAKQQLNDFANGKINRVESIIFAPAVAVLDLDMPEMNGFTAAAEIQKLRLGVKVVILTMHKDETHFNRAIDLGASGFVIKDGAASEIVQCIKSVNAGREYFSPALHRRRRPLLLIRDA